jgi:AraC family transcriptional regulator
MTTPREKLAAELSAPGICVQVLDYRWSAGETITETSQDFVMSYRSYPRRVSLAARLPTKQLDFGRLFFFPAGVQIDTNPANQGELVRTIRCRFEPEWFSRVWQTSSDDWDTERLERCMDIRSMRIEQAVQRLGVEAMSPGFASPLMADALSNMIAVELARYLHSPSRMPRMRTRAGKLTGADLKRISEYLGTYENKCPSTEDIAAICNVSPGHLRRAFKATTGQTVHDYIEEVRLQKTKRLLETDLPLKEVSYRVGFSSLSSLSTGFKRLTGVTPSDYRHRHRSASSSLTMSRRH